MISKILHNLRHQPRDFVPSIHAILQREAKHGLAQTRNHAMTEEMVRFRTPGTGEKRGEGKSEQT